MFSLCRHAPTFIALLIALATFAGCSKPAPQRTDDWSLQTGEVVKAHAEIGGIATRYEARFDKEGALTSIIETRTPDARELAGAYTFKGARLLEYKGPTIDGAKDAALTFNLQGALTAGGEGLSPEEIAAVTNRAQLLRSLALTRKTSQGHGD
ncbi:hypothetical protein HNQ60_003459 [Povalibacter uvarum]|uniref:Lipoprotein n=1 Tax=Povalibacter uvarum TaxID=732238 RepID=A0A841HRB9_9GAMM|nr:hypothetical protein [Povalibacter uvarum]MBB6094572.1 hypothetical protein [Povalibacter uvarum]